MGMRAALSSFIGLAIASDDRQTPALNVAKAKLCIFPGHMTCGEIAGL
jgi:hypothetical protein